MISFYETSVQISRSRCMKRNLKTIGHSCHTVIALCFQQWYVQNLCLNSQNYEKCTALPLSSPLDLLMSYLKAVLNKQITLFLFMINKCKIIYSLIKSVDCINLGYYFQHWFYSQDKCQSQGSEPRARPICCSVGFLEKMPHAVYYS